MFFSSSGLNKAFLRVSGIDVLTTMADFVSTLIGLKVGYGRGSLGIYLHEDSEIF